MNFATVQSQSAPVGSMQTCEFSDLAAMLCHAVVSPSKEGPGWVPGYIEPGPRTGERVAHWDALALDVEGKAERLPDGSDWAAILRGPIVLAHPAGTRDLDGLFAGDGRMAHVAQGPLVPLDQVPSLLCTDADLPNHIVRDSSSGPLAFRLVDVVHPAAKEGLSLVPFFGLHEQRYQMYWNLTSPEKVAANLERLAAAERDRSALEAATLDSIAVGEQQPEVEHDLKGEDMATGTHNGRRWRHGAWIQYTLDPHGAREAVLSVTYFGGDGGREFDILVDGRVIATEKLTGEKPGHFIERRYPIPADLLASAGNGRLTVKFSVRRWLAGGLFGVRLLRPEAPPMKPVGEK